MSQKGRGQPAWLSEVSELRIALWGGVKVLPIGCAYHLCCTDLYCCNFACRVLGRHQTYRAGGKKKKKNDGSMILHSTKHRTGVSTCKTCTEKKKRSGTFPRRTI